MPKPKICVIGPLPPPANGMSVCISNLLEGLNRSKFGVIHLDTSDARDISNIGRFDIRNIFLALSQGIKFIQHLITQQSYMIYMNIAQNRVGFLRDCLFLIPAKLSHRKFVVHLHGSAFDSFYRNSPKWFQWLIRWTLEDVDRAIVLSESLAGCFQGIIPDCRVVVVPNGIQDFWQTTKININHETSDFIILYLSTIVFGKGYSEVLEISPKVISLFPHAKFVFAGEVYDRRELERDLERLDLASHPAIHFTGPQTGISKIGLLETAKLFLFPPLLPEGQPLVLLEAMAAGLPIITTRQKGEVR